MRHWLKRVVFAACLLGAQTAAFALGEDEDFVQKESRYLIVHYKKDASNPAVVEGIIRRGEEYLTEFRQELGLAPLEYFAKLAPEEKIKVYLYSTEKNYHQDNPDPFSWGDAEPDKKSVYIFPDATFNSVILPHELGHVVFYEAIGPSGYSQIPKWLNEGVACHMERGSGKLRMEPYAREALLKRNFVPLKDLDRFRLRARSEEEVFVFYGEATSAVNFLINTYGPDSFKAFCRYLKEGHSLDEAVKLSFSGLNNIDDVGTAWETDLYKRVGVDRQNRRDHEREVGEPW